MIKAAIAALVGTAMLAACGETTSAPTTSAPAAAKPARCSTRDVRASLLPQSPGAGQRFAHVQLTNIGSRTCTIFGYAGAQLLRANGSRVPTDIVRDRSRTPHLITLRHGRRASAGWHWGAIPGAGEPTTGDCEPSASTIEITPPDETTSLRIRWTLGPVCEHGRIDERPFSGPY